MFKNAKDKRRARRRPMRYTAWIAPKPGDLHGCVLSDVSDSGARIRVEDADTIPDCFMLMLARNGKVLRPCRVVWRKPQHLGVTFLTHNAFVTHVAKAAPATPKQGDATSPPLAPAEAEPRPEPAEKV
jgi:PilZ domain